MTRRPCCEYELPECRQPFWQCPECGNHYCEVHKCEPGEDEPTCPQCRFGYNIPPDDDEED